MPVVLCESCGAAGVTVRTCVVVELQEVSARQSNTPSAMPARASAAFRVLVKLCPAIVICFFSKPLPEKPADLPARTRLVDICGTICSCGHQLSNASCPPLARDAVFAPLDCSELCSFSKPRQPQTSPLGGNFGVSRSIQNTYHQRAACQKPAFPSSEWVLRSPEP